MFDIDTCKWVVWGAKTDYNTYGFVQNAFLRALKYSGKDAVWLDVGDNTATVDFSNTLFLSMDCIIGGMPRRDDCFYVVHNGLNPECYAFIKDYKFLSFGVLGLDPNRFNATHEIDHEIFFDANRRAMSLRWGTDLLPHEIEANKPKYALNAESHIINYVGSIDQTNREAIGRFANAAATQGIKFLQYGGWGGGLPAVSMEENVHLVKESYLAPALQRADQVQVGYVPCRLFKNISYGQFGITHSPAANSLFGGKLIYNSDTYRLFFNAQERLLSMQVSELHSLMDEVAQKHTYLNKVRAIIHAVRILENQ